MRNLSASLTKDQIRQSVENVRKGLAPVKDVTRRVGWLNLKVGERLQVCEKCQGLKHGESLVRICVIEVVSARREQLARLIMEPQYGAQEVMREGFSLCMQFGREFLERTFGPDTGTMIGDAPPTPNLFVKFFCDTHKGCTLVSEVTRIEFKYVV
jgi:hypothetical protein